MGDKKPEQINALVFYNYIVDKYSNLKMGARPLKRPIQSEIEDLLAEEILEQKIQNGDHVKVRLQEKKITFEVL